MQAGKLLGFCLQKHQTCTLGGNSWDRQTDGQKRETPGQQKKNLLESAYDSTETSSACRFHLQAAARCLGDLKGKSCAILSPPNEFFGGGISAATDYEGRYEKSLYCFQSRREFSSSFVCLQHKHQKISAVPQAEPSYHI